MKPWLRLMLVAATVGGGFTGFTINLASLFIPQVRTSAYVVVVIIVFALLYAFVTMSGLWFVQNPRRTVLLRIALGLQIPWCSSPMFGYRFAAGFQASVYFGTQFGFSLRIGSDWHFDWLDRGALGMGVNLFALISLILLLRAERKRKFSETIASVAVSDAKA